MAILDMRRYEKESVVVIGKFDGVHKGHQRLMALAKQIRNAKGFTPLAYTFPASGEIITSDGEKADILTACGIEQIYVQPFTEDFKNTSPENFVRILKDDLCAKHVIVGFNFRFGKERAGDASLMKDLCIKEGIEVTVAEPVIYNGEPISSTRIRSCIADGNIADFYNMTGRRFSLSAPVIQGKQLGREIGFPTVNMSVKDFSITPQKGVYAAKTELGGRTYPAITNIGENPTVDTDNTIKAETHIIGFDGDLYGEEITIEFLEKIRDEKVFENIDALKKQLTLDKEKVVKIFECI